MTQFERLWSILIKPWVAVLCLFVIVVSWLYLDKPIAYYLHDLNLIVDYPVLNWVTKLGLGALYFIPLFVIALYYRYIAPNQEWEMRFWFLWLCVVIPSLICLIIKVLVGRARPELMFTQQVFGFYGLKHHASYWSFPSGHTSTIMGFACGLSVLLPRYCYGFIFLGLVIASMRVLLNYHYFSDVLFATFLALVEIGLLTHWLRRKKLLIFAPGLDGLRISQS